MAIDGYIEYQRREYCRDLPCPIQVEMDKYEEGSQDYERIRAICNSSCIHTTYEFHHWLIDRGYILIRPGD